MANTVIAVSGVVVDDFSGAIIPGAEVAVYDINAQSTVALGMIVTSGMDGRFSFNASLKSDAQDDTLNFYVVARKPGYTGRVASRWIPTSQSRTYIPIKLIHGL